MVQRDRGNSTQWPCDVMIDLSVPIAEELPVSWPGHRGFEHVQWRSFESGDFYQTNFFTMDEHCGTHCDAPAHFMRPSEYTGMTYHGDSLPLDSLHGPLVVIDVRALRSTEADGISPEIPVPFIQSWENMHRDIQQKDVVVFHTGWDELFFDSESHGRYVDGPVERKDSPGWPVPSIATIDYLVAKGVRCFGIDAASMGASQGGLELHRHALSRSLFFVEGLANLDRVPVMGYHFLFLPLKMVRSTGCPGRAVAVGVQAT